MKHISYLRVLIVAASFLGDFLYSSPVIVSGAFKPSAHFKHLEKEIFSTKVTTVLIRAFTDIEAFINHHNVVEAQDSLQAVRNNVAHFSVGTFDKTQDALLSIKNACVLAGNQGPLLCQQLYIAVFLRAVLKLCNQADEVFIETIAMLEQHGNYWDEQYAHPHYYFFHRSPLKWSQKTSYKSEIMTNKKCISDVQHQYEVALGENALLRAEFNDHASVEEQFAWIKRCCVDISKLCLKSPLNNEFITQENCGHIIKQLSAGLRRQDKHVQQQISGATMPSHFEHNWALYTVSCSLAIVAYLHYRKHPNFFSSKWDFIKHLGVENYNKYLNKPVQDIGEAIGFKKSAENGLLDTKKLNKDISNALNKIIENIGEKENLEEKDVDIQAVRGIYRRTAKKYREFHNSNFKNGVDWNPTNVEIAHAAYSLDKRFLRRIYDVFSQDWQNASLWQMKSLGNQAIPLMNVVGQVATYRGSKVAEGLVELTDPITQFIQFGMKQSEIMVTQTRLTVASLALLPAAGIMWGAYKGIRSFGGFLLPKGYDDTPIKNYILKMQDLLDDILYIDSLKTYDALDACSVGKLLYYGAQLEDEIKNVSQKNRIALKALLEKFTITNDLKGKHLYLEKMLREYESWTRFIKR